MSIRPPKYLLLWHSQWLKTQYEKNGLSTYQIAEIVGCTQPTVFYAMKRSGIKSRKYTMSNTARLARQKGGIARHYKKGEE